jgi:hypothetical protein
MRGYYLCSGGKGIGSGYERERERGRARGRARTPQIDIETGGEDGVDWNFVLGVAVVLVMLWVVVMNLI